MRSSLLLISGLLSCSLSIARAEETKPAPTEPTTTTDPAPTENNGTATGTSETPKPAAEEMKVTEEDLAKIVWEEFSADNTFETPFAHSLDNLDDFPERRHDWDDFLAKLAAWEPGHVKDVEERVRNLLCVSVLEDIGQGQFEAELPLHIYNFLRKEIPDARLKEILSKMSFYPSSGKVIETCPELNLDIGVGEDTVRQRLQILAVKMLGRMLGKLPIAYEQP